MRIWRNLTPPIPTPSFMTITAELVGKTKVIDKTPQFQESLFCIFSQNLVLYIVGKDWDMARASGNPDYKKRWTAWVYSKFEKMYEMSTNAERVPQAIGNGFLMEHKSMDPLKSVCLMCKWTFVSFNILRKSPITDICRSWSDQECLWRGWEPVAGWTSVWNCCKWWVPQFLDVLVVSKILIVANSSRPSYSCVTQHCEKRVVWIPSEICLHLWRERCRLDA